MDKTSKLFLFSVILAGIIISPACALSVKFTDQSLAGPMNLDVYYVNGSFIGSYNTTQQLDINESVIIHIAPDRIDYLRDPNALITEGGSFLSDNILAILAICFVLGFVIWRR